MDLKDLMKKAQSMQEQLQNKLQATQQELSNTTVVGEAGAGMVKAEIYVSRHDAKRISLEDSLLKEDKQIIEDLIAAAFNDAIRKAEKITKEKMSSITSMLPGDLSQLIKKPTSDE